MMNDDTTRVMNIAGMAVTREYILLLVAFSRKAVQVQSVKHARV